MFIKVSPNDGTFNVQIKRLASLRQSLDVICDGIDLALKYLAEGTMKIQRDDASRISSRQADGSQFSNPSFEPVDV